ncbi:MAG: type IV toxin-antitoxin system AbiEi family antitoxin domain-containing protein [Actinobacteria bacterium]|nr:type IV toxin-antitoxin system AbiEi family antitoxin domain-containing protein [Actinomycetota bacterium]
MIAAATADLAERQHGVVTRAQLQRLGLSDNLVDGWTGAGRIHRVFHGVYAVGRPGLDERGRIHAAVLACRPGAVASHRSAAYLLRIGERSPRVIDVIPPNHGGRAIQGVKAHLVPHPAPSEWSYAHGIPCTSPARTIVDLAGVYGEGELGGAVERAATERMLDLAAIDAILENGPRRRGVRCLRRILAAWRPVAETAKHANFRSLFEAKLLPLIAAAGLPLPSVNAPVRTAERTLEVDFLWEHERFVVEATAVAITGSRSPSTATTGAPAN